MTGDRPHDDPGDLGPAIRVQGLEKSYGKLHVLRGVDFDVARGSIFALLGSNGLVVDGQLRARERREDHRVKPRDQGCEWPRR